MSSEGRAVTLTTPLSAGVAGRLYDFDVGKARLKPAHARWLIGEVVPLLNSHGSVSVSGLASRTATDSFNLSLSRLRAAAVLRFLRENTRRSFNVRSEDWRGEAAAAAAGQPDDTEDDWYRAVIVSAWSRPTPPPVPTVASPQRTVRRITELTFSRDKITRDAMHNREPDLPGQFDAVLDEALDQLRGWLAGVGRESNRRVDRVPADHAVNEVYILVVYSRHLYPGHEVEMWTTSVRYVYGPPSNFVRIQRNTIMRSYLDTQRIYPADPPPRPPPPELEFVPRHEAIEAPLVIPPEPDAPRIQRGNP
jgi:outer membrane protein OmpA-like peptidoglycan-associated protein